MLKFTFLVHSTSGHSDPQLKTLTGDVDSTITIPEGTTKVLFNSVDEHQLILDFFNKQESDTVVDNQGNIVKDTEFRFESVWCDDIKLESWFLTDAVYQPKYFPGFLKHVPDAPKIITSPYQFNFPGTISWNWQGNFWDWYFVEKNKREVINFLDHDPDRVWKFRGSLDPCEDLVVKIKKLLDL
jgi:hypothetical protein